MENVILTIHLILALLLIGVVLLQRSEGGGLGIGGGGGTMSARGAATAMTKLTWIFAAAFITTSITLTILAANGRDGGSVIDSAATAPATDATATDTKTDAPATDAPATTGGGLAGTDLTLPGTKTDAPVTPPPADAPAAPPANP
jgi:preprotein translocase subunit SecG